MTNNKTIIITGALGQDGKILSKILINKGYKIFGIVNTNKGVKIKSVRYQKIKLYDYKKIKKFIKKINPSHIVHFGSKNPSFGDKDNFFKEAICCFFTNDTNLGIKNELFLYAESWLKRIRLQNFKFFLIFKTSI